MVFSPSLYLSPSPHSYNATRKSRETGPLNTLFSKRYLSSFWRSILCTVHKNARVLKIAQCDIISGFGTRLILCIALLTPKHWQLSYILLDLVMRYSLATRLRILLTTDQKVCRIRMSGNIWNQSHDIFYLMACIATVSLQFLWCLSNRLRPCQLLNYCSCKVVSCLLLLA